MKITVKEKLLIVAVALMVIAIGIKSIYFDPFVPQTESDKQLMSEAQTFIELKHDGSLYQSGIMKTRIIKVGFGEDGTKKVHYRKYVAVIFPFGDEYWDLEEKAN